MWGNTNPPIVPGRSNLRSIYCAGGRAYKVTPGGLWDLEVSVWGEKCVTVFQEILAKAPGGNTCREGPVLPALWHRRQEGVPCGFLQDRTCGRGVLGRGHCLGKGVEMGRPRRGRGGPVWGEGWWCQVGPCECGDFTPGRWFWVGLQQGFLNQGSGIPQSWGQNQTVCVLS